MQHHRILFIDAYDSFSNSIVALLRAELSIAVECIKINEARFVLNDEAFFSYLDGFDAVVAGPGPGHPANVDDVGLIGKLWNLPQKHLLPVLGICLGFQSLCLAFGAKVERLREPRHGIMTIVDHCNRDLYRGTGKIVATQYHSLHVRLGHAQSIGDWEASTLWQKSEECIDLLPLSWASMSVPNGPTLMGVRHEHKPYWGVQYHPESICTNKEGQKLVSNWWAQACEWRAGRPPLNRTVQDTGPAHARCSGYASSEAQLPRPNVQWSVLSEISSPHVANILDLLRDENIFEQPLLLESGTRSGKPVNPETGRFSIIGLQSPTATQYRYSTVSGEMQIMTNASSVLTPLASINDAFSLLDRAIQERRAVSGPAEIPFWGGLVGFVSYEAGLQTIDVPPVGAKEQHPDLWFVMIDRSIVVDHVRGAVYVQTIRSQDKQWLDTTHSILEHHLQAPAVIGDTASQKLVAQLAGGPEQTAYCQKVLDCQANLRAGESYELCLTDQSILRTSAEPWTMYKQLRSRNPAPFSAFLRFHSAEHPGISIVGSSPERFLSWSRNGKCQFRPIKGTVKKGPGVTRARAEELLASPKERAENLMIVDLIRHDLAGVKDISKVDVPKLMSVEEYETVYQLVSVIEGTVEDGGSGSAALLASLPPGSMTGAPKKRSCELLSEIEGGKARGLYSGVIGYFDVGGGGDFSVVIRTAFKWDDQGNDWHVGAGGAITALSDPQAEWEEMLTKRESVLTALL
ncbi:Putative ADC synthase, anthranilate synthase component I, para-aminobenzoate synthase [Septoria linicola]|uniref:aminodeoxychorismate synthase n=1 Tax=Septoria linicola TaxID=215465 RepID=A0A9Q9APU5_9PEZI|nr:putative ADC synthase, anthranilate synthase component I, para-aminobenzoate synthase [Septoria linicola]USW49866.1 Putative ADC synthase, anthranilate synthase component I, para-aminobenzoate synthase [Septoria linicola]